MNFKQKIEYILLAILMFILITLFEFFCLKGFTYIFSNNWVGRTSIFIIVILLFNPYIVYKLMNLIPFKVKGLKVDKGLKEALRREIE